MTWSEETVFYFVEKMPFFSIEKGGNSFVPQNEEKEICNS
jgi:hypothetical protein